MKLTYRGIEFYNNFGEWVGTHYIKPSFCSDSIMKLANDLLETYDAFSFQLIEEHE